MRLTSGRVARERLLVCSLPADVTRTRPPAGFVDVIHHRRASPCLSCWSFAVREARTLRDDSQTQIPWLKDGPDHTTLGPEPLSGGN